MMSESQKCSFKVCMWPILAKPNKSWQVADFTFTLSEHCGVFYGQWLSTRSILSICQGHAILSYNWISLLTFFMVQRI